MVLLSKMFRLIDIAYFRIIWSLSIQLSECFKEPDPEFPMIDAANVFFYPFTLGHRMLRNLVF